MTIETLLDKLRAQSLAVDFSIEACDCFRCDTLIMPGSRMYMLSERGTRFVAFPLCYACGETQIKAQLAAVRDYVTTRASDRTPPPPPSVPMPEGDVPAVAGE